jgi:aldehyde:ferredoxin oxidoreductase
MVKKCMIVSSILDSLGLCKVPAFSIIGDFSLNVEAKLIQSIAGLDISPEALYLIGERILHMEKIINIRQGGDADDDSLPELFLQTPIEKGPIQGRKVNLVPMVREFYRSMDWDERGRPTQIVLQKFDLSL